MEANLLLLHTHIIKNNFQMEIYFNSLHLLREIKGKVIRKYKSINEVVGMQKE